MFALCRVAHRALWTGRACPDTLSKTNRVRDVKYPRLIEDLEPLLPAEAQVLEAVLAGDDAQISEVRPSEPDNALRVRASFIRFLAIGGCETVRPHPKGVSITGACVDGMIDLDLCDVTGRLGLLKCLIPDGVTAVDGRLAALALSGARVGFVTLDGATIAGNVFLNDDFRSDGPVDLSGARLGGQLSCIRGRFENEHGDAFAAQNATVAEILYWRDVSVEKGSVRLTGMHVGGLADDEKSWPGDGRLMMDGFTYDRIVYGDTSATRRLVWLEKHVSNEFQPQPYQHLAKVVGDMGHRHDRGRVLMEMERKMRAQQRKDMWAGASRVWPPLRRPWNLLRTSLHRFWDRVLRHLVGYGYRPWWALFWALPIVLIVALTVQKVWDAGDFAPNAAPVLMSAAWQELAASGAVQNPAAVWSCTAPSGGGDYPCAGMAGRDYETFKAPLYALDLFVPLVNLGQDDAWAPSTSRGIWGRVWHDLEWIVKTIGWVMTAMVAGAVAGVIRND